MVATVVQLSKLSTPSVLHIIQNEKLMKQIAMWLSFGPFAMITLAARVYRNIMRKVSMSNLLHQKTCPLHLGSLIAIVL